jgi:hypothetical protein
MLYKCLGVITNASAADRRPYADLARFSEK